MLKYAVIVAYEPDLVKLNKLIEVLLNVNCVPVVVDNSEANPIAEASLAVGSILLKMPCNLGIAQAQNNGLRRALADGADIIGFFDQDSEIDKELITCLINGLFEMGDVVVAPVVVDKETGGEYPSFNVTKCGRPKEIYALNSDKPVPADIVISSGTFTTKRVIKEVGFFDEDFFIDFVDIEWSLRCRGKGINIYVIPQAILKHKIGNGTKKICGITISVHSPSRTYYKVRNSFLLRKKKMKKIFVIGQIISAVVHNFFLIFDKEKGKEYKKFYFAGIKDGIKNKTGKYRHK